ncbi:MAG: hypothetical protein ACR2K5_09790 [Pseudolabrys sp.]
MCQACFEADAVFRRYLLQRPAERDKLTPEEADYYGFKRDIFGQWIDAWDDIRAVAVEPAPQ